MPANDHDYELLDAGGGRRLERFGTVVTDRPAPGTTDPRRLEDARWKDADARFDRGAGWQWRQAAPVDWRLLLQGVDLELRAAEAGQVGVFPEHTVHWDWLRAQADGRSVLHLFGYTGATTACLGRAGAAVTHVDAARTAVSWARRNATLNGLAQAPLRWLVDDAATFASRERRRGRRYHGIVLDPPSYGHGPGGRRWRLEADLDSLVEVCAELLDRPGFVLLTSHTPSHGPEQLGSLLGRHLGAGVESGPLGLEALSGSRLGLGSYARWRSG